MQDDSLAKILEEMRSKPNQSGAWEVISIMVQSWAERIAALIEADLERAEETNDA